MGSAAGHGLAALTILIWGTTFISTKILLADFAPVEILVLRFLLGYVLLWAAAPRRLAAGRREELTFAAAGFCGICLYYLLENVALVHTSASHVGVIISLAPFFTALLARRFAGADERAGAGFYAGFAAALTGVVLLMGGGAEGGEALAGDLLAAAAALVWAAYSLLTRRISRFGCPAIPAVRRTFFYGLCFMAPAAWLSGATFSPERLADPAAAAHLLYLGAGASALCFVTWNQAVRLLGAVKTSAYIYAVPVITVLSASLVLGELLPLSGRAGVVLVLGGLFLSERSGAGRTK